MKGIEVADPYVERLLEGVAFLGARVQLKMDAEFPRFSQRLLEVVYPNYLAPTPATAIVRIAPKLRVDCQRVHAAARHGAAGADREGRADGVRIPDRARRHAVAARDRRGDADRRAIRPADQPAADRADGPRRHPPAPAHDRRRAARAARARSPDVLSGRHRRGRASPVRACCWRTPAACWLADRNARSSGSASCRHPRWSPEGFDESQALFPYEARSFQGYRLLHEYFAFPARYLFCSVTGLKPALQDAPGDTFDIVVLLDRSAPDLERIVDDKQFALFCTPAVNLFPRRSDRLPVAPDQFEHHVVMDRARPLDFEVYSITQVEGHAASESDAMEFRPFYGSLSSDAHDVRPLLFDAPRAAAPVGSRSPAGSAHWLHRQRGVPVARRPAGGAVSRRSAAADRAGAVHQPRFAAADAARRAARISR